MKIIKLFTMFIVGGPLYLLGFVFGVFLVPILNGIEASDKWIGKITKEYRIGK